MAHSKTIVQNKMRWHISLFDLCCQWNDQKNIGIKITVIVLDNNGRSDAALLGTAVRIQIHHVDIPALVHPVCGHRRILFLFLPRVANLDFSFLSVYVTVGCSHSPPYYLKQQIAVIYSSIPFRICPRHPRKPKTLFSCGKSFSRPAAYRIHRVLTSPWFSPSCPKAEVSLFCDGS